MAELKKLLGNRNNRLMLVIFIIGIVIVVCSSGVGDRSRTDTGNCNGEEARLGEILSEINGAGEVSVMIAYEKASDTGFGSAVKETPRGVIVVADGAVSPSVRAELKEATVAVMGLGANRVCVYPR